jgi:hypothetical protein
MSNIFYSNVDENLQRELNKRGQAGATDRTTPSLNFMLNKIANVRLTAYTGNTAKTPPCREYGVLGGETVTEGRYVPSGPNGFLNPTTYSTSSIVYGINGAARDRTSAFVDDTRRVGPIVTGVEVNIGDHSMGLLNKATVNISIPNPTRDLEGMEDTWLRPGRYMQIEIIHPTDAVITSTEKDGGKLKDTTLPNPASIKERYPEWEVDELLEQIRYMHKFVFQGLITSFELNYTETAAVDITLQITGTSNVFTDITMLMNSNNKQTDPKKPTVQTDPGLNPNFTATTQNPNAQSETVPNAQFFDLLNWFVTSLYDTYNKDSKAQSVIRIDQTDQYVITGQPYDPYANDANIAEFLVNLDKVAAGATADAESATFWAQRLRDNNKSENNTTTFYRYITLGALVEFTNRFIINKLNSTVPFAKIVCDDILCNSNYLPYITSCIPNQVLLLPKINSNIENDVNVYGDLKYYDKAVELNGKWPGVYGTNSNAETVIFPSRIFINLNYIQSVVQDLSDKNSKNFKVSQFFAAISKRIAYATGNAIELKLVSHPKDLDKLLFTDVKFVRPVTDDNAPVIPYSVPMMANHPYGTIVRKFNFDARLPESAKNLSYVLNQGDEVTEEEIAPYMNFMYNSKDPDAINKINTQYKQKHKKIIDELLITRKQLSFLPSEETLIQSLYKSLTSYLKYPAEDLRKSQQITAPIFPFDVTFEIDGINGLRYGDVLTFDALPARYRVNTAFSIIGIRHSVSVEGQWTTEVKCIMRPNIG